MDSYQISQDGASITCFVCGFTSHNQNDVKEKYCGYCKTFHNDRETIAKNKHVANFIEYGENEREIKRLTERQNILKDLIEANRIVTKKNK